MLDLEKNIPSLEPVKAHYFTLKTCGFDGEIKTVLIRYIHFVNEKNNQSHQTIKNQQKQTLLSSLLL